jgi:hypothetical protein
LALRTISSYGCITFASEIEVANPDAGEADVGAQPVPEDAVSDAFHLTVMGDHNVVNAAGRDATQTIRFDDGRWDRLRETLADLGVPADELDGLKLALETDASRSLPNGAMGPATADWYEKLTAAAGRGAIALSSEVAGGVIAIELLKFLGAG